MEISELYKLFLQYPTVTTDSRNCPKDSVFFALKGESFDGNTFANKALQAGCAYAVIDNPTYKTGEHTILVDDALTTLQQLASFHRRQLNTTIIGITGTNGKTTTKELIAAVLSQKYNTLFTQGNLNNHIGVPLTLLRLTRKHEIAVVEMGANHPGEIKTLVNIVQPNFGIITNVGYAHLEGFGSFEGVVKTKGELYDYLRANGGKVFINQGNGHLKDIAEGLEKIFYGDEMLNETFVGGQTTAHHPFLSLEWQQQSGKTHNINTHLVGDYNLWNVLAAVAIGRYFDVGAEQINKAVAEYVPTNNRSQWKKTEHNELIIDAYNANPSSMRAALDNFASLDVKPKAVILGDMRELGEETLRLHGDIMRLVQKYGIEKAIFCGEIFSKVANDYQCFQNLEELKKHLEETPLQGYHILVKGSHGTHLEQILNLL